MEKRKILSNIYSKNYFVFIAIELIPILWKVLEISLLTNFQNGLKIISQLVLFSIIFKIFQETIITPLYKALKKQGEQDVNIKPMLIWVLFAVMIFTISIFLLINPILKVSQVPNYILTDTANFMKIYVFACGLSVVSRFLYTHSIITKNFKQMITYLLLKSVATAALFVILIPKFAIGLGANGIAISELIINAAACLFLFFMLPKTNSKQTVDKKEYAKLVCLSFFETLTRNLVYYFVVLVLINTLDKQDIYFVANEYIWSIVLVPTLSQNSLIKQELSNNSNASMKPFFLNTLIILAYMLVAFGLSAAVYKYVYGLENYMTYFMATLYLMPCYIVFIFDAVAESYFIAIGKLHHVLIQTIITNICVYLVAYILYLTGVFVVSFNSIIVLFNIGVIVSSAYTLIAYYVTKRKQI